MNENQVMVIEYEERVTVTRYMRLELSHDEVLDFVGEVIGIDGVVDNSIFRDPHDLYDLIRTNPEMLEEARHFNSHCMCEEEEDLVHDISDVRLEDK